MGSRVETLSVIIITDMLKISMSYHTSENRASPGKMLKEATTKLHGMSFGDNDNYKELFSKPKNGLANNLPRQLFL